MISVELEHICDTAVTEVSTGIPNAARELRNIDADIETKTEELEILGLHKTQLQIRVRKASWIDYENMCHQILGSVERLLRGTNSGRSDRSHTSRRRCTRGYPHRRSNGSPKRVLFVTYKFFRSTYLAQ